MSNQFTPVQLARLRWRARRGLLENDLIISRFLEKYETTLTDEEIDAFSRLLDLPDNELLDLLLERKKLTDEFNADLNLPHVHALLMKLHKG